MHKVTIIGNLGQDPSMKYLPSGTAITSFSVAASDKAKKVGDKWETSTTWYNVSVFGDQAEACNRFLAKGKKVYIEGQLRSDDKGAPRLYTRRDGTIGSSFEVDASFVQFLDSKSQSEASGSSREEDVESPAESKEDIPF